MPSFVINNTIFTGKFLIHEPHMLSTNLFAKKLISKTTPIDGSVIITDEQTLGKGQGNNEWNTEKDKNLTFSIIYNGSFLLAKHQFYLSMAIANGIYKALINSYNLDSLFVKWPNDIILNGKKLGGVLIENTIVGNNLKNSIIGIGINVNQTEFKSLEHATSLKLEIKEESKLEDLLPQLCSAIESEFLKLKRGNYAEIIESYNEVLFKNGETFHYSKNGNEMNGYLKGVNELGQLIVDVEEETFKYNFGEIKWRY